MSFRYLPLKSPPSSGNSPVNLAKGFRTAKFWGSVRFEGGQFGAKFLVRFAVKLFAKFWACFAGTFRAKKLQQKFQPKFP